MKVLIADDELVSRRLLESSLRRWGYEVIVARDGFEAWEQLQGPDAPRMAVLDWMMPGMDGAELCRQVRQSADDSYTYILLLTSKRSRESVVEGLEAGADDYVSKPFDPQELRVRLRTGKRILYLMEQLVAAREALRNRASHDSLTGLLNRAAVLEILDQELGRAARQQSSLGVILVDLDHFKAINDAHGHAIGDQVLCAAAHAMRTTVRVYDAVGRYGGEEFLVVLPGCDEENAASHAERLRAAISRSVVMTPGGERVRVSASLGVQVARQQGVHAAFDLIQSADAALYRAKQGGRDRVEMAAAGDLTSV